MQGNNMQGQQLAHNSNILNTTLLPNKSQVAIQVAINHLHQVEEVQYLTILNRMAQCPAVLCCQAWL